MPYAFNPFTGTFDFYTTGGTGPQGPAGPQGPVGFGIDGADPEEPIPIPGPQGPQGATGATGPTGPTGAQGLPGVPGVDGEEGEAGMPIPGPTGATGATGAQGPTGATGPAGPPVLGFDGDDGADALFGIPGPPGAPGTPGTTGATGQPGPPVLGFDGEDGADALFGIPGAQGIAGATGMAGVAGPPGFPGVDGDDGADGIFGNPGPPGPQGQTGAVGPAAPQMVMLLDGDDGWNDVFTPLEYIPLPLDNYQSSWWPSMSNFSTAAPAETRFVRSFTPTFTMNPSGTISHTLNVIALTPTVTMSPATVNDTATVQMIQMNPTLTMGQNAIFKGIFAQGTYTQTAAPLFGSWTMFSATPTLNSTTATVSPVASIAYNSAVVSQYNATGSATGVMIGYQDVPAPQNAGAGTFTLSRVDSFKSVLNPTQTAGTLTITLYSAVHAGAAAFTGTVGVTTAIGVDVENYNVSQITTGIGVRSAITSGATEYFLRDIGGARSEFIGSLTQSYTPTGQLIPTGFGAAYVKRQQWTGTQRLTVQGTGRMRGS